MQCYDDDEYMNLVAFALCLHTRHDAFGLGIGKLLFFPIGYDRSELPNDFLLDVEGDLPLRGLFCICDPIRATEHNVLEVFEGFLGTEALLSARATTRFHLAYGVRSRIPGQDGTGRTLGEIYSDNNAAECSLSDEVNTLDGDDGDCRESDEDEVVGPTRRLIQ